MPCVWMRPCLRNSGVHQRPCTHPILIPISASQLMLPDSRRSDCQTSPGRYQLHCHAMFSYGSRHLTKLAFYHNSDFVHGQPCKLYFQNLLLLYCYVLLCPGDQQGANRQSIPHKKALDDMSGGYSTFFTVFSCSNPFKVLGCSTSSSSICLNLLTSLTKVSAATPLSCVTEQHEYQHSRRHSLAKAVRIAAAR